MITLALPVQALTLPAVPDHGVLPGLLDNDHTQYVNAVSDTSSIDLTLTGQSISGVVLPAGVDHGGLAGLLDDDHPQYWADTTIGIRAKSYSATGIVTAGEFNTTGSVGNTGTLASFGVDGTTAVPRSGLVEMAALGSGFELPATTKSMLSLDVDVITADMGAGDLFRFGQGTFVNPQGAADQKNVSVIGIFGGIVGTDAMVLTGGLGTRNISLNGLEFSVSTTGDLISSSGGIATQITRGFKIDSTLSNAGNTVSGSKVRWQNFGGEITAVMSGQYDSILTSNNCGLSIVVTDSLNDASTGDIESIGLDITVPVGSTHGGGGVLTSWGIKQNSDVINAINGQLRVGDVAAPTHALEVNGVSVFGDGGTTDYTQISATGDRKYVGSARALNLQWDTETFTSDDTLDDENVIILLDGNSNAVTATLPTAVGIIDRVYYLKSIDGTFLTDVATNGSETIDGDASWTLSEGESITIVSDNANWWII